MEQAIPTAGEKQATANVLNNIAVLLKKAMHFGDNAGFVSEAIAYLENMVKQLAPEAVADAKAKKAVAKPKAKRGPRN